MNFSTINWHFFAAPAHILRKLHKTARHGKTSKVVFAMKKKSWLGMALSGLAAGAVAGLFGAGGGMVLVPLLTLLTPLEETEVFPSSITIILPICLVTLAVSAAVGTVPWQDALPYLFGSAAGGWAAGMWGRKIPVKWLHRGLGILILWGGYRYLCC